MPLALSHPGISSCARKKGTLIHGLKPLTGCYYEWSKVKEFWANR